MPAPPPEIVRRKIAEIRKQVKEFSQETPHETAMLALAEMRTRTLRGISIKELPFVSYAPETQEYKGRAQPVTLFDERHAGSHMLDALHVTKEGRAWVVSLRDARSKLLGRLHQEGRGRLPIRQWFGLTIRWTRRTFKRTGTRFQVSTPRDQRYKYRIRVKF